MTTQQKPTKMMECPDCAGYGYTETLTWLTYDGDQTWRNDVCETCWGAKEIEVEDIPEEVEE